MQIGDKEIINYLMSSIPVEQDLGFSYFYKDNYKQKLQTKLSSLRIPKTEFDDIYQNCVILLYEQVRKKDFELKTKLTNYFSAMIKYEWFRVKRKESKFTNFEGDKGYKLYVEQFSEEELILDQNKENLLSELLTFIDENCRKTLVLFYYHKLSMNEIAANFNYSSAQVAKNKKLRCLKKLQKYIADNNLKSKFS